MWVHAEYGEADSGGGGCTTFDFDGDGAAEVVAASFYEMFILDGRTGAVNLRYTPYANVVGGLMTVPVIADVNRDGSADLLFASSGGCDWPDADALGMVTALTHVGRAWPPVGSEWPSSDFSVTNMGEAGHVPTNPEPFWLTHGVYRGRTPGDLPPARANLRVEFTDVCIADCTYGPVALAMQVSNDGGRAAPAGVPLTLYTMDGTVPRVLITSLLPEIPAGTSLDGVEVIMAPEEVGTNGFLAVVDDDGTGAPTIWECHEDDNMAWWEEGCP